MSTLLLVALSSNPYAGRAADVTVTRAVDLPPERVTAALSDLGRAVEVLGEGCAVALSAPVGAGVGSTVDVRWTPGPMNRRLTVKVTEVEPGRKVRWEALGPRGFFTTFRVDARDTGSQVAVDVPLLPPPWPVRGVFYREVQPAWAACLGELVAQVGAGR